MSFIQFLFFFYILHQIYRILEFHFSDRIFESRVINYPKNSAEWRIHLGNFIRSLTNPSVILGTNLAHGEVMNFFNWNDKVRSVNLRLKLNDLEIQQLIEKYHISHIVLSPETFFLGDNCTLGRENTSRIWEDKLKTVVSTSNLKIFEVLV